MKILEGGVLNRSNGEKSSKRKAWTDLSTCIFAMGPIISLNWSQKLVWCNKNTWIGNLIPPYHQFSDAWDSSFPKLQQLGIVLECPLGGAFESTYGDRPNP